MYIKIEEKLCKKCNQKADFLFHYEKQKFPDCNDCEVKKLKTEKDRREASRSLKKLKKRLALWQKSEVRFNKRFEVEKKFCTKCNAVSDFVHSKNANDAVKEVMKHRRICDRCWERFCIKGFWFSLPIALGTGLFLLLH